MLDKELIDATYRIGELLKRGYSEKDIEKICYLNVFRVWNKAAEVASKLQAS